MITVKTGNYSSVQGMFAGYDLRGRIKVNIGTPLKKVIIVGWPL